jgi:hypothetical protein
MERVTFFQRIIQEVIVDYLAELRQPNNQHITFVPVIDTSANHYQIIALV